MRVRTATGTDLVRILEIYAYAREYMASAGNPNQWINGYPKKEVLESDIEKGHLFIIEDEDECCIHGVFAFIIGDDPTYDLIENGSWLSDDLYGTIHRIAGDGKVRGLLGICLEFCKTKTGNIRIDTHHDNKVMQHLILKHGFKECGIIYTDDGSPRIAYQWISE